MKRISEVVTIKEIRKWKNGNTITISAGTGKGKSYFIKNNLYAFAKKENKKILFLIHRTNCLNQFQSEIDKDKKNDVIDMMTYQKIEYDLLNNINIDFSKYQYIVCDEFHYFLSDASYNFVTDISLNMILDAKDNIKIFMSATGQYTKGYINGIKKIETIDYEIPLEYEFIENLTFFYKDNALDRFVKGAIKTNNKAIIFIDSAKKAYELYQRYEKYCLFNCSRSNNQYYKYVKKNEITKMLEKEKFDKQILITTTAMDAGVNIIDNKVNNIICDVKDIGVLIQCMGRKRIQNKNDKIELWVKAINNKQLGGMKTQLKRKIEMADYFKKYKDIDELIKKYPRKYDNNGMIYDISTGEKDKCSKKINELAYYKCKLDMGEIEIMKRYGNYGYCKYLSDIFGIATVEDNGYINYNYLTIADDEDFEKDEQNNNKLIKYLDSIVGKKLFKREQEKIKEVFKKNGLKARTMGINTLNGNLKDRQLPYIIVAKQTSKMIRGKKKNFRYWEVINEIEV